MEDQQSLQTHCYQKISIIKLFIVSSKLSLMRITKMKCYFSDLLNYLRIQNDNNYHNFTEQNL